MALTEVFWVMATAILTSGIIMMYLADKVSDFLNKNRMYEVLGLFILFGGDYAPIRRWTSGSSGFIGSPDHSHEQGNFLFCYRSTYSH